MLTLMVPDLDPELPESLVPSLEPPEPPQAVRAVAVIIAARMIAANFFIAFPPILLLLCNLH
jgi:hypothetical protein